MKPLLRRSLLALGVVAALASVVAGREKPSTDTPNIEARLSLPQPLDLSGLQRREAPESKADPFASRSFASAAPAAAGAARPAGKPAAPPLPFVYLGKVIEEGKLAVFLAHGEESYSVAAGDTIGGEYRVDAVTESEVRFTYLPLKTKQKLPL